ncbi:nucleotide sugar dehydrogenase [Halorubrum sp. AD140]|uniref:nucleotide sugar dehydrogenase n=1 Tax=Halorubrum sp. AD140 TaxID=3050073 RepID=UPI002ACC4FEB|nr:nucleotide sugar dehydrogenase [Halorubrum sp. AD140]MDZ5810232.1 nucleotide sugar dehydrogenase [Halorubrum sp. AD140]
MSDRSAPSRAEGVLTDGGISPIGSEETPVGSLYGSSASTSLQRRSLLSGEVPVAVYGLGKMGLPLAAVFADVTGRVVGADVDPDVVAAVNAGESHVDGEPGLDELVSDRVESGALRAVSDPREAAAAASVHVIVVPTLLTESKAADLAVVDAVVDAVATELSPGDAVFVESTVPPRTCADRIAPRLAERSGLPPTAFGVAFCPERTSSGRALRDIREAYPKVVGGVDDESTRVARLVYDEVTDNDVIPVRDAATAEATKVFGGVYRDVNIALANEFARYAREFGVDAREAIEASNTQPYSHILSPGPGVGGHCIPVYPYFLLNGFDVDSPLIRLGRVVNDEMPTYTVDRLRSILRADDRGADDRGAGSDGVGGREADDRVLDGARTLVLGVTYHPDVDETRNSPAVEVIEALRRRGAAVDAVDPVVTDFEPFAATRVSAAEAVENSYDAVVVVTPHEAFSSFDWDALDATTVLDCHDALDLSETDHRSYAIGRPHGRDRDARDAAERGGTGVAFDPPASPTTSTDGGRLDGRSESDEGGGADEGDGSDERGGSGA